MNKRNKYQKRSPEYAALLRTLYINEGMTIAQIASHLHKPMSTIGSALSDLGIRRADRSNDSTIVASALAARYLGELRAVTRTCRLELETLDPEVAQEFVDMMNGCLGEDFAMNVWEVAFDE